MLADLTGRPVPVPGAGEHVAAGACVQAAAVLHATGIDAVAADWGLARGRTVDPHDVDRDAIRAAYARAIKGAPH